MKLSNNCNLADDVPVELLQVFSRNPIFQDVDTSSPGRERDEYGNIPLLLQF
jgi:hypothetical protein